MSDEKQPFHIIEEFASDIEGCVIEIGSDRGEGSTPFFNDFCKEHSISFHTVDMNQHRYETARQLDWTQAYHCKGEEFAHNFLDWVGEPISFIYLDNFDWVYPDILIAEDFDTRWAPQFAEYENHGGLTNFHSQLAHLEQAMLLEKYCTDKCFILFDDTWTQRDTTWTGKGGAAIPYLTVLGFRVERTHFYGKLATLMVRDQKQKPSFTQRLKSYFQHISFESKRS